MKVAKRRWTLFSIIKPNRCTNFTNIFCHETLHVSDSSSVHHQEFIHCTLSNGICHTAFELNQDGTPWSSILVLLESCLQACMTYTIAECIVNKPWWWTDELSETCWVSWQNKFVKLVHLVGFITKKAVLCLLTLAFGTSLLIGLGFPLLLHLGARPEAVYHVPLDILH